ncbi:uncharacterized protein [Aristolochia californica]|uniref:uncharacterized protein n=1 Tax=Aristolochia californica TaxID=171875 RepID=UPI0035DDA52E
MYENMGSQAGMQGLPLNPQPNPFGNTFYDAGSGLIRGGLGAYGERILGSSSQYVQSNISRYFSDPQYYFQVNDQYVRNKLKVILFPFLHRGHWTRITEPVGGRLSYKPPIYDINAPDLYIPFMAFGTYVVLAGFLLGILGKFTPEALSMQFATGPYTRIGPSDTNTVPHGAVNVEPYLYHSGQSLYKVLLRLSLIPRGFSATGFNMVSEQVGPEFESRSY